MIFADPADIRQGQKWTGIKESLQKWHIAMNQPENASVI